MKISHNGHVHLKLNDITQREKSVKYVTCNVTLCFHILYLALFQS